MLHMWSLTYWESIYSPGTTGHTTRNCSLSKTSSNINRKSSYSFMLLSHPQQRTTDIYSLVIKMRIYCCCNWKCPCNITLLNQLALPHSKTSPVLMQLEAIFLIHELTELKQNCFPADPYHKILIHIGWCIGQETNTEPRSQKVTDLTLALAFSSV